MIGLSSNYFGAKGKGIYDSAKEAFALGFDVLEIGCAHPFEENAFDSLRKIKRDFPGKEFTFHCIFPPAKNPFWFNACLGLTRENKETVDSLFKGAEIAEAKIVGMHPGFLFEAGWNKSNIVKVLPVEKAWKNFADLTGYALELAENIGTALAAENNTSTPNRPLLLTVEEFSAAFKMFPQLRFLFDFGHASLDAMVESYLDAFGKITEEVHLHESSTPGVDEHGPIKSLGQLQHLKKIPNLKSKPIIFELSSDLSREQLLEEKKKLAQLL